MLQFRISGIGFRVESLHLRLRIRGIGLAQMKLLR